MAQYDHPINAKGLAQARTFRDAWLSPGRGVTVRLLKNVFQDLKAY